MNTKTYINVGPKPIFSFPAFFQNCDVGINPQYKIHPSVTIFKPVYYIIILKIGLHVCLTHAKVLCISLNSIEKNVLQSP